MKPHLLDMTLPELRDTLAAAGESAFRADQLADWVYRKGVTDPAAMSNVPNRVADTVRITTGQVVHVRRAADATRKILLEYPDGAQVEAVMIPAGKRITACVSTQSGCAMGCAFCASGLGGLERNLTSGEICEQLVQLRRVTGRTVTYVVLMGMGEPLANYDATLAAVRAMIDPKRFGLSARHVTLSTVGIPAGIRRLADEDLAITLAISLHAPTDELRRQLMPRAAEFPIQDILRAARSFYDARHREVTLEYLLLAGVNDTPACAVDLADIAQQVRCNVNLIPYNPVAPLPFARPTESAVENFARRLRQRGVNVHVRHSRGQDVAAACGQLRRQENASDEDAGGSTPAGAPTAGAKGREPRGPRHRP